MTTSMGTPRILRRSREQRVAGGVAGGLGEYFGLDPVLFRVLFATAAFFGGIGLIAYLIAWAILPEDGSGATSADRWIAALRRRHIPVWVVVTAGGLLAWALGFGWWSPGTFLPIPIVIGLLIWYFGGRGVFRERREAAAAGAAGGGPVGGGPVSGPVNLVKDASPTTPIPAASPSTQPQWASEAQRWFAEARAASRRRRDRARPTRIVTGSVLVLTIAVLAIVDSVHGIAIPVYFYALAGVIVLSVAVGLIARRPSWVVTPLLVPAVIGIVATSGSHARFHDGVGDRNWTAPAAASGLSPDYRFGAGRAELDLRGMRIDVARTVHVRNGLGQVRIQVPAGANVVVRAHVHFGQINTTRNTDDRRDGGYDVNRVLLPPAGATGPQLIIDVRVTDGEIQVLRG